MGQAGAVQEMLKSRGSGRVGSGEVRSHWSCPASGAQQKFLSS